MKNILKLSITALATAALLSGCIKETFPESSTTTDKDVTAKSLVNAISASMMSANTAGYGTGYGVHTDFGYPAIAIITENMLEDVATLGDNPYYNRFYSWAMNSGQGDSYISCAYFWDCYYHWIKLCNLVFQTIDPASANVDEIGYVGQAYAFRALCYLDMARLFEPKTNGYTDVSSVAGLTVPIVTEATTEADGRNNPRVTREMMYKFILEDLKLAEQYLTGKNYNYTLPTVAAVYGLYARAYIEMGAAGDAGAYAKAAEYARKAITASGRTPLTQAQWEDARTGFNSGASNNSWMWGLTLAAEQTNNLFHFMAHMSTESTWGYAPPGLAAIGINKATYEKIPSRDFRKHTWIDPQKGEFYNYQINGDRDAFLESAPPYLSLKFRPVNGETKSYTTGGIADFAIMRVEEMYFLEIEATAQTNLAAAQGLLNDFMKLRVLDGSYDCTKTTTNLDSFLKEMLFQKRIEFWGEGILIYDYKRLNMGFTRGYPGTNHPSVYRLNSVGRSPQWNIVITRGEGQTNQAVAGKNNPDPTGKLKLWVE